MIIRPANPADAQPLAELRYEFRSRLGSPDEQRETFIARCRTWMESHLASSAWKCWVVERANAVEGGIWLQVIEKIPNPVTEFENLGYITNLYLRDSARGHGLGERLLETTMTWCRANDIDLVMLMPSPRSRSLYLRHGFAVHDDLMSANLGPRSLTGTA
jgi:GNAT superfamily N-acetyltransferase